MPFDRAQTANRVHPVAEMHTEEQPSQDQADRLKVQIFAIASKIIFENFGATLNSILHLGPETQVRHAI